MAIANRDQNYVTIEMGVDSDNLTTPLHFLVDPTTGRLLITIEEAAGGSSLPSGQRDGNYVPALYGVNATDLSTPMVIPIDPSTGTLEVDIIAT